MKRAVIIGAVVLAHVLLLLWLLSGTARRGSDQPEPQGRGVPSANDIGQDGGEPGTLSADENSDGDLRRLSFTVEDRDLPATLKALTGSCRSGILVEWPRRRVLWKKAPDTPVAIASMAKMMTCLLLVETLNSRPDLTLETAVRVSRTAAAIGGRQVYLDPRESLTVDDLIKCMMIFSANDVAHLTAEFIAGGDAAAFVARMNRRAAAAGLLRARFVTPHGLTPADGNPDMATPREMAFLASRLVAYSEVTRWSSTRLSYIRESNPSFKPFQLVNTNKLVGKVPGVDGMKTGYTKAAGYCLTCTCDRQGRRLIAVVTGCASGAERDRLVEALLEWAYGS